MPLEPKFRFFKIKWRMIASFLGGGRSIQLSYWRISVFRPTLTRAAGLHRKGTAALF